MDSATLVGPDIQMGSRVVRAMEDAGIPAKVALWMMTPEYEEGRLVIAAPALDQVDLLPAYERIVEVLRQTISVPLPALLILRMRDPFIRELRSIFGKAASVEGMRLGGQKIGNRFILDAYVYRIR